MNKLGFNPLFNFISPVTGRIPLALDYILVGDESGRSQKSPALIDVKLDIIELKDKFNKFDNVFDLPFILKTTTSSTPNAQGLDSLAEGFLYNVNGILSTKSSADILPSLNQGKLWIGDANNKAVETQTVNLNNLPALGTTSFPSPTGFYGQVYVGTSSGIPEASSELAEALTDLELINARFLTGQFILNAGIPYLRKAMPAAQYLQDLPGNSMLKTSAEVGGIKLGLISQATAGTDYLPGITPPPYPADESNFLMYGNPGGGNKVYSSPMTFLETPANEPVINLPKGLVKTRNIILSRTVDDQTPPSLGIEGAANVYSVTSNEIILWDSKREQVGRSQDGVRIIGPNPNLPAGTMLTWYLPQKISTLGQVLKDVGGSPDITIPNARTLGFGSILPDNLQNGLLAQGKDDDNNPIIINATLTKGKIWQGDDGNKPVETELAIPSTNATYIIQKPDESLPNAQALDELDGGILKSSITGVISIASGGGVPITNDYVRPTDLQEAIDGVIAEATEAGTVAGTEAGTIAGTAAGTASGTIAGTEAGTVAGTASGTIAGTAAASVVITGTTFVESAKAGNGIKLDDSGIFHHDITISVDPVYITSTVATVVASTNFVAKVIGSNGINIAHVGLYHDEATISIDPTYLATAIDTEVANISLVKSITAGSGIQITNIGATNKDCAIAIATNPTIPGKGGVVIPIGATIDRLTSANIGTLRYNTDLA